MWKDKDVENSFHRQLDRLKKEIYLQGSQPQRQFSLFIAVFNHYPLRDRLIKGIGKLFKDSVVLKFDGQTYNDFHEFERHLNEISENHSVIHLVNVGERLYRATWPDFYKEMNYGRERIAEAAPVSVIMWMLSEDVRDLGTAARDMWSWRAGVFDFSVSEDLYMMDSPPPFQQLTKCDLKQKNERIAEIDTYLSENQDLSENLRILLIDELGLLYYTLANYNMAKVSILKSLNFYLKAENKQKIGKLFNMLESVYWDEDREDKALAIVEIRALSKVFSLKRVLGLHSLKVDKEEKVEQIPYKILVVDDESDMELYIKQNFRKKIRTGEWEFVYLKNGREALKLMENNLDIDVILLDINMPEMDGLTFLDRLKALDNPVVKTIMVTAYGAMENIRAAMNGGAFDFLTKPIDADDLKKSIYKAIREIDVIRDALEKREKLSISQRDLELASELQQASLPEAFPIGDAFEIFAGMIPTPAVGGNFYNCFLVEDSRLVFYVGDVSEKGLNAVLFMEMCNNILIALGEQVINPGECLSILNNHICMRKSQGPNLNASIVYGVMDVNSGMIECSRAGHIDAPYILKGGQNIERLPVAEGKSLGFLHNQKYDVSQYKMEIGSICCIYTNGVRDAKNPQGKQFETDEKRLVPYLESVNKIGLTAEKFVKALMSEINIYSAGIEPEDDITILAVKYK